MCELTKKEQDFLEEIKCEKDGVPFNAAHTMINPNNDVAGENLKIISQLISKGFLKITTIEGIDYLQASEISDESKSNDNNQIEQFGCEIIGYPHSPFGMKSLRKEFLENTDTLYLVLGTTSYETFKDILEPRMASGYKTIFIYPSYKAISNDKKEHYKIEKRKWEKYLAQLPRKQKKTIEFRIAVKDYAYIRSSMFAQDHARINVRIENNNSARKGIILRCENSNTIYKLIKKPYEEIVFYSFIDIRTDIIGCCLELLRRNIMKIVLIIFLFVLYYFKPDANGIIWAFLAGIISNIIIDLLKEIKWNQKELFRR